ncbi:MAG: hypothetical protein HGA24_10145, partial [Candidatus Aminicenantes bacterium]|nr:hypothetical protein [Candidatus Aminicenantes bacterium]
PLAPVKPPVQKGGPPVGPDTRAGGAAGPPPQMSPGMPEAPERPAEKVKMLQGSCPRCGAGFAFRLVARPDKPWLDISCKSCRRTFRLRLDGVPQG